jgi:hypothetical protein
MAELLAENLKVFNSAMGKAEFKEKLGRVLQYGARMISGMLTDADKVSPSKDRKELMAKVSQFFCFRSLHCRSILSNQYLETPDGRSGFSKNSLLHQRCPRTSTRLTQ